MYTLSSLCPITICEQKKSRGLIYFYRKQNGMSTEHPKPLIGFSCGDLNGIGIELIIKTLSDNRILEQCSPVIFASNKSINFYRKSLPEINFNYQSVKDFSKINTRQLSVFNCWDEEVVISAGQLNETGGKYFRARDKDALRNIYGQIDKMEKSKIEITSFKRYKEKFLPFVLTALALLLFEWLLRFSVFRRFP